MNKKEIYEHLIVAQKNIIAELESQISIKHTMVDIDEDDTIDPEDYSHQYESQEIEQMIKAQRNRSKADLTVLESLDISPKNTVSKGALVETDKVVFFIGFAAIPFDWSGRHIVGISLNSPIFSIMANKVENNSFSYGGQSYKIEKIY